MKYNNPSIAVDVVLFSLKEDRLHVLIRKRGEGTQHSKWALPGAIVSITDRLESKAREMLRDKVGITEDFYLEQLYTFDRLDRDIRGENRVISVAYLALVDFEKIGTSLSTFSTEIEWVEIAELPELAFDHREIIVKAVERLKNKVRYTSIGFSLIPTLFTIPQARRCFESILGININPSNFRSKLLKLDVLVDTGSSRVKGKGQPASIYKLDLKKVMQLSNAETLFNN